MSPPLTSSQSSVQALWFIAHTTASKKLVRFRLLYQSSPELQDINKHRKFRLNIIIKGHISWLLHLATKRQEKNIEYAWKFQLKTGNFIYQSPESLLKTITSVNKQKEYWNQMLFANSFERWGTKKILSSRRTLHVGRNHGFSQLQGFICSLCFPCHSGSAAFVGSVSCRRVEFCPLAQAAQLWNCSLVPWQ